MSHKNVDIREIEKFSALAKQWWDPHGKMGMLHTINPLRLKVIEDAVPLKGKKALDVGCGGGILTEEMARSGAVALGIDLAEKPLEVAKLHAKEQSVKVDYRLTNIEAMLEASEGKIEKFDVVVCMEITPHGILDVSITGLSALLWLGYFPSIGFICLGLLTAFAGYTAIYALNDLISYKEDREKMDGQDDYQGYSVEATAMRHPVAQNFLSMQAGVTWFLMWSCVAVIGAYLLNPVILAIFLVGGVLEAIYCLLLKRTCLRVLISGVVKTCGPIAAVFAATPEPSITFLSILFFWVFFWEIGGQNIPADWNDVSEDLRVNAKTIPAQFGPKRSSLIILSVLGLSVLFSLKLLDISPINFGLVEFTVCFAIVSASAITINTCAFGSFEDLERNALRNPYSANISSRMFGENFTELWLAQEGKRFSREDPYLFYGQNHEGSPGTFDERRGIVYPILSKDLKNSSCFLPKGYEIGNYPKEDVALGR
ncbi:Ubiquinone biosynthesis O-methyltransferase [Stylophora pistillata]|uniref:Ubiquinone biosynthesis O-methyltransferase n=1 Tax=Stylophora pistillata TaxID=50429 RepID=A0A2B4R0L6_STYPI|nr:Ubiquinone biosynthesis O-methyltransferase [Stylophora pistillata]